jgi:ABC-type multidrug transport system fused ATPase/permease subunit
MQSPTPGQRGGRPQRPSLDSAALRRTIQYLTHYQRQAVLPYLFLIIATISMLFVPRLLSAMIDAITNGVIADTLLTVLNQIPTNAMGQVLPRILSALNLPATWAQADLVAKLTADKTSAPNTLILSAVAIVLFSAFRGVFSFLQDY